MTDLDNILAAITRLSPQERQRLWRRARQMGLISSENETPHQPLTLNKLPRSVPVQNSTPGSR